MAFGATIQFKDDSFASGEVSITFASTATLGNLLIVGEGRGATHTAGGAWAPPSGWNVITDSGINVGNMGAAWYWKISDGTETGFLTAHTNEQGNAQSVFAEFEGPFAVSPLDVTAEDATHLASAVTSQSTGTTGTTAQNDELALAFFATDRFDTSDGTRVYTNSFAEVVIADGAAARATAIICKLVLSATGTQECTFSVTDTGDEMYGALATFKKSVAGGDTALVVADSTHAHETDNTALTQAYVLTVQDAGHASGAENVALEQAYLLAVADAAHAHTVDAPALTQAYVLAVADAAHSHTAEAPALTQAYTLTVADAGHVHTSDNVTISPDAEGDVTLVVADVDHAHAADSPALTQGYVLAVADATHSHTADTLALVAQHVLTVADSTHIHTAETVVLDFFPLVTYLYPGTRDVRRAAGRSELLSDAPGRSRARVREPIKSEG